MRRMSTPLRIALLAPLVSPIAPPWLGGAQVLLADLAAGLAARGHDVTLFAADGSDIPGVRVPSLGIDSATLTPARFTAAASNADEPEPTEPDDQTFLVSYAFLRAYRAISAQAASFDLVHAHAWDWPAFSYGLLQPLPIVHTLHLPAIDPHILRVLQTLAPPSSDSRTHLVTVSHACAATYTSCRIDRVIYNGIDVANIPVRTGDADERYLLFAGRIAPEKGVEDALAIAEQAGVPLVIAGSVYDEQYYAERIAPAIARAGARMRVVGHLQREDLWRWMAGAAAVLCPVQWDEPFGLVACEAQATGTPVIGYARGGLPEVVANGETGYLVGPGDVSAAANAVAQVGLIDRARCRARVAEHFTLDHMLDAHEAFYHTLLAGAPVS